ncbi:MAG: methyltransferase domain-containing protein [Candidatus Buchananbacteria bacterium]|nr:methyltransferase domain-containing protein [Candidatus Buchananbacteria bacterium]
MNFMVRPSKSFLFDLLESKLCRLSGEVGLDAACDNMKNRRMFKTKKYIGLDINLETLIKVSSKSTVLQSQQLYSVHADMANLNGLTKNSCDVVVSTNTIYQIPKNLQANVILNLCEMVNSRGTFICELSLNDQFDELLAIIKKYFVKMQIYYYKNWLSQKYEKIFERDGYLGSHPIASKKFFRFLAWLISRGEFLTYRNRRGKKHAVIIATARHEAKDEVFSLSGVPIVAGNIYSLFEYQRNINDNDDKKN